MRCPKCGRISFDYLNKCPGCGRDLKAVRQQLGVIYEMPAKYSWFDSDFNEQEEKIELSGDFAENKKEFSSEPVAKSGEEEESFEEIAASSEPVEEEVESPVDFSDIDVSDLIATAEEEIKEQEEDAEIDIKDLTALAEQEEFQKELEKVLQ